MNSNPNLKVWAEIERLIKFIYCEQDVCFFAFYVKRELNSIFWL